jgi:hypothetical protein
MGPQSDDDKMVTSVQADAPVRSDLPIGDPVVKRPGSSEDAGQVDERLAPGFTIEEAGYGHGV